MEKLLNIEILWYYPKIFKFMQVHENEEDQEVNLVKESKRMLSLIHTRDKNSKNWQEKSKISNRHYHIQDIKDEQH